MHFHTSGLQRLELGIGGCSCNWGVHIAGLYETSEERDAMIFGFLGRGVEDGEAFFAASRANGRRNVRATTEMVWALYSVTKFDGATITGALRENAPQFLQMGPK